MLRYLTGKAKCMTCSWHQKESQKITKVIVVHPLGMMNVCTIFKAIHPIAVILVWAKVVHPRAFSWQKMREQFERKNINTY